MNQDTEQTTHDTEDQLDWRTDPFRFGGAMVAPSTEDATAWCKSNGTYFETPNAYFIEGWEDGDCADCTVVGIGEVPSLGGLSQSTLKEIWEEGFYQP
jgi:hypothetical protein